MTQIKIIIVILMSIILSGCATKKAIQEIVVQNSIKNEFKEKLAKDKKAFQSINNDLHFINNQIIQNNKNALLREKLNQVEHLSNFNNILYLQKESTIQLIQVIEKSDKKSKELIEKTNINFKKLFDGNNKLLKENYEEIRNTTWKMEENSKKIIEELKLKKEQTTNIEVKNYITNQIKNEQINIKYVREVSNINAKYYQNNTFNNNAAQINN